MTEKVEDGKVLGTISPPRWYENWKAPVPWADRTPGPEGIAAIGLESDHDAKGFANVLEHLVEACMWSDRPALECVVMYTTEAGLMMQANNGLFFCMVEYLRPLFNPEALASPALFWHEDLRRLIRGLRSGSCSLLFTATEDAGMPRTLTLTSEQDLGYMVNAAPLYEQTETYPDTGELLRRGVAQLEDGVMKPTALNCEFIQWLGSMGKALGDAPIRFLHTAWQNINLMEMKSLGGTPKYRGFVGMMPMFVNLEDG